MDTDTKHSDKSFFPRRVPVDSVCIYRIGFGLLLCLSQVVKLPHITEYYSSEGFHIGYLANYAPSPAVALTLSILLIITTLMVAIGFRTRIFIIFSMMIWIYLYLIDTINEKAIDSVVIVVMVILLFTSCDARYSIDDWLRRRRKLARKEPTTCVFWQRLLQIEFVQIYFFAGMVKMMEPDWVNGNTVTNILMARWARPFSVWVTGWMPPLGFRMIALGTILYELVGSLFLFVAKCRKYIIVIGICFHLATVILLYVRFLGYHYIWALLILFPDPETISQIANKVKQRFEIKHP